MIGTIVGNYKIIQALGEGGVGMVYKGVDTMLDREVAIKVLRPELASQTSVVERFRSEAVTLAKLSHPNIATLYSLFRHGDHLFMVLEFIKGETLDQILHRRGAIPTDEAIPYFCQALEGINYAHERGIVHRDIKPGNMMLAEDGILKVLDFGIARLLGTNRMTRIGNVIGTLEYMSPEQVKGLETDARSDVYGLGIMLYEILTGRLPFESENDFELMKMQTEQMPVLPRQLNPNIPVEVENIIVKAISKNPNHRFASAGDFLNAFFDLGFALPNLTLGFGTMNAYKKMSRPSNPGIQSGETKSLPTDAVIPTPQNPVTPVSHFNIPKPDVPVTLEVGEELKKEAVGETKVAPVENKPLQQGEIKGTRLASSVVTNPNEIKATRLGAMESNPVSPVEVSPSSNFFSQLTWVHYASAGAVAFFVFSLIATAAAIPFIWGGGAGVNEVPKNLTQKPNEPKNVSTTPTPVSTPKAEPTPQQQRTDFNREQVSEPTSNPNPTPVITPIPDNPQPVQNPPKERERETVKTNPTPAPRNETKRNSPPPAPKPKPVEGGGTKKDLRKILTDN